MILTEDVRVSCKMKICILGVKMKVYLVIFTMIIPTLLAARTFRINNQCNQKLWFGIQGQPLIYAGGFDVEARSVKDISVPDGWVREDVLQYCFKLFIVG